MIQATRPLSKEATKSADDSFYQNHPEMVKNGQRQPLDPCDPKQAGLRDEWMKSYEANGGKVEKSSGAQCSEQVNKANKQADSAGKSSPTGAVAPCPYAACKPPDVEKIATTPKPNAKPGCTLVSEIVKCQHGRQPKDGLLYVVPDSYGSIGDQIVCTATTKGTCGEHVAWSISGMWTSQSKGNTAKVLAKTFKPAALGGWAGLQRIDPQVYRIEANACSGGVPVVEIRAYPPDELTRKIDFEEARKTIKDWLEHVPVSSEDKAELEKGWFLGSVEYKQQWKEEKASHLAYCESSVNGSFSPLFGAKLSDVPVYPLSLVPAGLQKWLQAGVYFSIKGGCDLTLGLSWKYSPQTQESHFEKTAVKLGGSVTGELSVNLFLVNKNVTTAKVSGETGLECTAEWASNESAAIDLGAKWTGLKAKISVSVCYNWISFERTYPILAEQDLGKRTIELGAKA